MPGGVVYHFDVVVLFVVVAQLSEDVSLASWSWGRRKCAQFNFKKLFICLSTGPAQFRKRILIRIFSQVLLSTEDWLGAAATNLSRK